MVKSCCAVGCFNKYSKGSGIAFIDFPRIKKGAANGLHQ